MVEQTTVNRLAGGSNPSRGAKITVVHPLKPLSTIKYYSDLFESPCRITVADTPKNHGDQDNQRHQGNTTLKNFGELWTNYLGTQLSGNSFLFIVIKLCKLLHICHTSDSVYI